MTTWASFWSCCEQDLHFNYLLVKKPKRNKPLLVFYFIDQNFLLDFSGLLGLPQWLYKGHVINGLYSCCPIPPHFVNFLYKFSTGNHLIQHQHSGRTLYVFFFPSFAFFEITDWCLSIKLLNLIREKWNILLGRHFYIKLVGGKKNGEVLAPPSWASWVGMRSFLVNLEDILLRGSERGAEGLVGQLLWALRGPLPPAWWARPEHAHWVRNWVLWFLSYTLVRLTELSKSALNISALTLRMESWSNLIFTA